MLRSGLVANHTAARLIGKRYNGFAGVLASSDVTGFVLDGRSTTKTDAALSSALTSRLGGGLGEGFGGGGSVRFYSVTTPRRMSSADDKMMTTESATSNFDATMDKIFQEQSGVITTTVESDVTGAPHTLEQLPFEPTWWPSDWAVQALLEIGEHTQMGMGVSIVGLTFLLRVVLLPVFISSQRNTSRIAHMQPEMTALKARLDALGKNLDQKTQMKYANQMRALFTKYNCNPMYSLVLPFVQLPVFMGMFFGIRKMPDYFAEELVNGGFFWFPDLLASDPYYILPMGCGLSFLATIELGKAQMMATNPAQGLFMVNMMRAMSVCMIPAIMQFSAALNLYWWTNNTLTMCQSALFANKKVRKMLGIWDPPKPVPGTEAKSLFETITEATQGKPQTPAEQIKAHNEKIENRKRAATLASTTNSRGATRTRRRGGATNTTHKKV